MIKVRQEILQKEDKNIRKERIKLKIGKGSNPEEKTLKK
jgi:hypothetical protein